ncbi:uncharacterized protein cubi_01230 [Cryptosporidium ubiquitum]|uniref:Uncharacterized protein n=1 Tax=Cryptosporidium ubiquitum TaxID=857276 RepID=A0A1J4MJE5_9CRYT|nr:uncharacterized protein cubi_01230 [Cryptosporidium ubiquitum]OII74386.1 hypothetical protein cubi_01230 [Cryptosporidium ubiquitum]
MNTKFKLLSIILLLIQRFSNKNLVKKQKYATELNLMEFGQQGILDGGSEEFISEEKLNNLIGLLKKKRYNSKLNEITVGDIKIRIVSRKNINFTKIVLDVEFGNQLNPLYYNSISSSDRCLLMLSKHFQIHLRQVFENYLSRTSFLSSESHVYFGVSKYYLEPKKSSLKEIELILNYVSIFFSRNIINSSNILVNYLLDLQINGNKYFMPNNYMRNLFLTVLDDKFRGNSNKADSFRDIYGDLKMCANVKNVKDFTRKYGHYFKRRIRNVEILLNKEKINIHKLERIIHHTFRKIHVSKIGFDHLKILTKINPFSEITKGILQINSNRVDNKVTLMFPLLYQFNKRTSEITQILDSILAYNNTLIDSLTKQKLVLNYNYEFEHNSENMYTNLLLNFILDKSLNSREELLIFNLINLIEIWLEILNASYLNKTSLSSKNILNSVEPGLQFENTLFKCLSIDNMVIIIYSNKPISINGVDILNLSVKINENKYWYFIRKLHSISYLIRKHFLPKLGIKYLMQKEDYYFSTKYVYNSIPSSLIRYFQQKYPKINELSC